MEDFSKNSLKKTDNILPDTQNIDVDTSTHSGDKDISGSNATDMLTAPSGLMKKNSSNDDEHQATNDFSRKNNSVQSSISLSIDPISLLAETALAEGKSGVQVKEVIMNNKFPSVQNDLKPLQISESSTVPLVNEAPPLSAALSSTANTQSKSETKNIISENSIKTDDVDMVDAADDPSSVHENETTKINLPLKRPSPWRQPRSPSRLPPPVRTASNENLKKLPSLPLNSSSSIDESKKNMNEDSKPKATKKKRKSKKIRKFTKLFRDSFQLEIPLNVTADLGIALQRIREKRVKVIYKHFPALQKERELKVSGGNGSNDGSDDKDIETKSKEKGDSTMDVSNHESKSGSKKKPIPKLKHVPKPEDYASVLDYLEAKYVQGIMIDDEPNDGGDNSGSENQNNDDDDEGGGSVYSETSFLDDSALQRTVVEQVLAHTTTTKLELIDDNDDDFFVNVGDLEVEETELTRKDYDPLNDTEKSKTLKRKRPKKLLSGGDDEVKRTPNDDTKKNKQVEKESKSKKVVASESEVASVPPKKKKVKTDDNGKTIQSTISEKTTKTTVNEKSVKSTSKLVSKDDEPKKISSDKTESSDASTMKKKPGKKPLSEEAKTLLKQSKICKKRMEASLAKLEEYVAQASEEELPRRPKVVKKVRVYLKCPADKKTGDMITFTNPHVKGQKLRVKIPATRSSTGAFRVTVPAPEAPKEPDIDESVDYNRISRTFYDLLEEYARMYDEWCDAEGEFRKFMGDSDFTTHFEKRKKFDALVPIFPTNLKTKVDRAYLQKILRRARQNKHKRDKTLAKLAEEKSQVTPPPKTKKRSASTNTEGGGGGGNSSNDEGGDEQGGGDEDMKSLDSLSPLAPPSKTTSSIKLKKTPIQTIIIPQMSFHFPLRTLKMQKVR